MKKQKAKPLYVEYYNSMSPYIKVPSEKKKVNSSYSPQVYFFELMFPEKIRGEKYNLKLNSLDTTISGEVNKGEFRSCLIKNLNNCGNDFEKEYECTMEVLKKHEKQSMNTILDICKRNEIEIPEEIRSSHLKLLLFFLRVCVDEGMPLTKFIKEKKINEDHLKEYLQEVIWKDGISGKAGIRKILYMAERSLKETDRQNPFILYEAGEIEYYGRGKSHSPNYEMAYIYYKEAATNFYHPLALWSMGYMIMELADRTEALQAHRTLSEEDKYEKALSLFDACLKQDEKCGAAYNSLGKACRKDIKKIPDRLKEKYIYNWGRTPIELFQKAKEYGNVYGMNNYYACLIEKARNEDEEERGKTLIEAAEVINGAADLLNPWAANRLAEIYFSGEVDGVRGIRKRDIEMAKKYYEIAVYAQLDDNCYWGNYNYVNNILLNPEITFTKNDPITESIRLLKNVIEDKKNFDIELQAKCCAKLAHLYYRQRNMDKIKELYVDTYLKLEEELKHKEISSIKRKNTQGSLVEMQKIYEALK